MNRVTVEREKDAGGIPPFFAVNIFKQEDPRPPVLRIRINYYADTDPGSKKCPYGSGS